MKKINKIVNDVIDNEKDFGKYPKIKNSLTWSGKK